MPERLPSTVNPKNYDLYFNIDFEQFLFNGNVKISIQISEPVSIIRLHSEELDIISVKLISHDLETLNITSELIKSEISIKPDAQLSPGMYFLEIHFKGKLNDDLSGFYRSRYLDTSGKEAYLATTQFEAPYARKAFPCFDEPEFKATFSVSMNIPEEMTGISNMPIDSETVENNRKILQFQKTPPMSTYLLYMGAGLFDYIELSKDDRTVRVYGINGKSEQGRFALQFAADTLSFFEQYSGVKYPLPKLDLLAIPDFAAGAMENWGACTFREVLLYVDDQNTSLTVKKRVAEVIAHELWHQWSGNLVTMKWWDDLWLNEAFATYQAFRAVENFFPQWHIWDDFIDGDTNSAFEMDMLSTTHPIAVPVHTANEIEEIFDHISYGKGGSVLRMIESYIGESAFQKGVSAYLSAFAYKSAVAEDLWNTLEQHSGMPVKDILVQWVNKPGFPLLKAQKNGSSIHISQQRFTSSINNTVEPWPVPLTWTTPAGKSELLFETSECMVNHTSDFVKFNTHQTGFYRTIYDNQLYDTLYNPVKNRVLHEYDRWGILNDLWASVFKGYANLTKLFEIMSWYHTENHVFVLREISSQCTQISRLLQFPSRGLNMFARYSQPFIDVLRQIGWDSDSSDESHTKQLRPICIKFLIQAGDESVKQIALTKAERYLHGETIDPDIRGACLSAISKEGTRQHFDIIKNVYTSKNNIEEKIALLSTLAEFTEPELLIDFLDYSITDAVRKQDLRTVFARVSHNQSCSELFFDWVKDHWSTLYDLRKSHFVYIGLLETLITTATDLERLEKIRDFLNRNGKEYEKTQANAFERAQLNISFREREYSTEI